MSGMDSHDVHAEHRHTVYTCDGCGVAYDELTDAYDCEEQHGGES